MGRDEKSIPEIRKLGEYIFMIFVTVGTHEQSFNRLVESVDYLVESKIITEPVIVQTGYCDYIPKFCEHSKFVKYELMQEYLTKASIVISHGGPSTFMVPISKGIPTIVMPRQKKFNEHVNDHQLDFCNRVVEEGIEIKVVTSVEELKIALIKCNMSLNKIENQGNRQIFASKFEALVTPLLSKKEKK